MRLPVYDKKGRMYAVSTQHRVRIDKIPRTNLGHITLTLLVPNVDDFIAKVALLNEAATTEFQINPINPSDF